MKLWRYGHAIEHLGQRYRLEGSLGSGGMADVCLAWDEQEASEVAIKVIKSDQLEQRTLDRFIKEAAQVARWHHPNILRIYSDLKLELLDAAQGSIVPYIVMEYAQGGDLHKRLTPGEPYPFSATLDLFAQLCSAVAYAHEHGVIHRDLKPLNILFRQLPGGCEQVVLSDFGLAVETDASHHTFAQAGTLLYMAPEQFRGHALPASDIFALGVILYQLCTGRLPFRRTLQELHQLNSTIPTPPSFIVPTLPSALDDIILTALSPDPAQRHPTAGVLWEAIHAIVYSNHLKPAYNTIPRRSSSPTAPRPAISSPSRPPSPHRAIRPTPAALNTISAQLDLAADSQDLPPPSANLAPHTSHTQSPQEPAYPQSPQRPIYRARANHLDDADLDNPAQLPQGPIYRVRANHFDDPDLDIIESSYAHGLSSSSIKQETDSEQSRPKPSTSAAFRPTVYSMGDPLRSPSRPLQSSLFFSPSHRSSGAHSPAPKASTATAQLRPSRPIYRVGAFTLLLLLICVGALLTSLIYYFAPSHTVLNMLPNPALMGSTTVTITPGSQQIAHTYTILATPNADQNQIAARTLSSQQAQTKTVNGTGHKQIPATAATGTVMFTNGSANAFTVAAGSLLPAGNGISVAIDAPAVIPAANPPNLGKITVSAHTTTSGANTNIPSNSVNGTCCTTGNFIYARNTTTFTGGQDAKNYTFVQQSDVDTLVNTIKPQLTQQANNALTAQLQPGEQQAQPSNCPATTQSDNPIGDQGQNTPTTTVTITVTCKAPAYDQNALRSLVTNLLQQQARTQVGSNYAQQGPLTIHTQHQQINQDQSLTLLVTARGRYTYQFSTTRKQQLARLIAGKPTDTARTLLTTQPGIQNATISTIGGALPSDAGMINIEVQGAPPG